MPDGQKVQVRILTAAAPARQPMTAAEFSAAVAPIRPRLVRAALRILRDHEAAEDAVQNGLLDAWRYIDKFEGRANLSTWLYSIIRRAAINAYRCDRRRRLTDQMDDWDAILSPVDVEQEAITKQNAAALRDAVAGLPHKYRAALMVRINDTEPANSTQAKTHVRRAIIQLRERLTR